ncbi:MULTISPECIES: zinc-ribbon domain-containing protein [Metallosphaera]|uniref:DZANK-type domain-containing protein n=1 Tax=Metallosphaera prunae TaxID=47304 RepID=A0A4D8RZ52_METPR|nr:MULTISPECIES: zinc ribbon domain-containing protein [Metallosphaera]MCY0862298.1 zinc ribbon domain-containing protein [Metallosphaera prunae]QCO31044.1 hypothetical protein DFR88_11550 [Metallosphaera prunae]WPX05361.1 zinc ribbon domain-containing protein [Metallosphaera sedula DSM 5348]
MGKVKCVNCGEMNPDILTNCRRCGATLPNRFGALQVKICPKCSRSNPAGRSTCLYCGTPLV